MNAKPDFFTDSKLALENYIENRLLLLRLQAVEKISKLSSAMFSGLLIAVISFFVILFLSMMAAWYFGQVLDNVFLGFAIITGFYVLLLILLLVFRKKLLEKSITNTVINIFFEQTHEHDDNDTNER